MPPGTVIRSFAAPGNSPRGLAWDGRALWNCDTGTDRIYQIDPVTGTIIRSFAAPAATPQGLMWDGRTLWVSDDTTNLIYQIDPITGTEIRSFAAPASDLRDLAWDGHALWHIDSGTDLVYQIDPVTGRVLRSFATPSGSNSGLTWDGAALWIADISLRRIYQVNPATGTVIRSFETPSTLPLGLTWDGRTLWHSDFNTDLIYQLSVVPGASYADRVIAAGPIAYWPQWEAAGTISFDISGNSPLSEQDGAYTGVTLAQPGIGDGRTAPFFDAVNDYNDIFSATLDAAFDGDEGSALIWALPDVQWGDGAGNVFLFQLFEDLNNRIRIYVDPANNLIYRRSGGGATKTAAYNNPNGQPLVWRAVALTWSMSAGINGEMIAYWGGVQTDPTQTALNAYVGGVVANDTQIGAFDTVPTDVWNGWLAHFAVFDYALTPATIADLSGV